MLSFAGPECWVLFKTLYWLQFDTQPAKIEKKSKFCFISNMANTIKNSC